MAKFTPGLLAGQISGRLGSDVFSHNKGGPYIRNGTIPTNRNSERQQEVRANLALISQSWQTLASSDRLAWSTWAQTNQVLDRLGKKITLTGHQCYVMLNSRLLNAAETPITLPPVIPAPMGLFTLVFTADIGAGNFQLAFTPTHLESDLRLVVRAAVLGSHGRTFVKNQVRQIAIADAATASPLPIEPALVAVFGDVTAGQAVYVEAAVLDTTTGLQSLFLSDRKIVVSTH